ncbi:hypothetical protein [Bradyrhizobium sp.]|uniref:hypothetical protein n=1 Tax=Bradyrhizobium sp. TaxID=376 RepID=UPI003C4DB63D
MSGSRITVVAVIAGLTLGALAGLSAFFGWPMSVHSKALGPPSHPKFAEVRWPFPTDEWGEGKAFRCEAADCGVEVNVYIRAKIGFCNCLTGVSDDNELDRLSDFNLMEGKPAVLGPGHEIKIAWMKGRSRAYAVTEPYHAPSSVLAIAFNDRCDAIVATATVAHDGPKALEPSVIDFLNSEVIVHWAEVTLGL